MFADIGEIASGKTASTKFIYNTLSGPLTTNAYQMMVLGYQVGFQLVRTDTSYTVVGNYYTNGSKDNSDPVTLKAAAPTTVGASESVTAPEAAWATYSGSAYTFDESKSTTSIVAVIDPASNVITLNYYRTVTPPTVNPVTPTPTPSDPGTDIPDPETPTTDIPEPTTPKADAGKQVTGDSGVAIWSGVIALLSLTGLVYVTVSGKKSKDN